jgi:hypothetical protein
LINLKLCGQFDETAMAVFGPRLVESADSFRWHILAARAGPCLQSRNVREPLFSAWNRRLVLLLVEPQMSADCFFTSGAWLCLARSQPARHCADSSAPIAVLHHHLRFEAVNPGSSYRRERFGTGSHDSRESIAETVAGFAKANWRACGQIGVSDGGR